METTRKIVSKCCEAAFLTLGVYFARLLVQQSNVNYLFNMDFI